MCGGFCTQCQQAATSQLFQAEASEQADAYISPAFVVPFAQGFVCLFVLLTPETTPLGGICWGKKKNQKILDTF